MTKQSESEGKEEVETTVVAGDTTLNVISTGLLDASAELRDAMVLTEAPQAAASASSSIDCRMLIVNTLDGKTIYVDVRPSDTILTVKQLIQDKEGLPPEQVRLIYAGQALEIGQTLASYKIPHEVVIHLVLSVRAGMFALSSGREGMKQLKFDSSAEQPILNLLEANKQYPDGVQFSSTKQMEQAIQHLSGVIYMRPTT